MAVAAYYPGEHHISPAAARGVGEVTEAMRQERLDRITQLVRLSEMRGAHHLAYAQRIVTAKIMARAYGALDREIELAEQVGREYHGG